MLHSPPSRAGDSIQAWFTQQSLYLQKAGECNQLNYRCELHAFLSLFWAIWQLAFRNHKKAPSLRKYKCLHYKSEDLHFLHGYKYQKSNHHIGFLRQAASAINKDTSITFKMASHYRFS